MSSTTPPWEYLPDLPLFSISARLPSLPEFSSFRGVCSSWRAASDFSLPLFQSSHPPLLCSVSYDRLFCPRRGQFLSKPDLPEHRQWAIGSSAGFLILAESSCLRRLSLANPITGKKAHVLPEAPHDFSRGVVVRGDDREPVIVAFNSYVVRCCRVGGGEWTVWERTEAGVGSVRNLGVLGERIFGLTTDGDLLEVDVAKGTPDVKVLDGQRLPVGRFQNLDEVQSYILACRCLASDSLDFRATDVIQLVVVQYYLERQCLLKCLREIFHRASFYGA